MNKIVLKNMAFYGYHGNLDSENYQGQRFFVDVELLVDLTKAGITDCLEDSINYVEVYNIVDEIMTGTACHLLERLGTLIADRIWEKFNLKGLSVAVRKPSVPIPGILDYAEITTIRGEI